jgi:hypothetical protein
VTDRRNSILNNKINFSKTNELIKIFLCRSEMQVIDKEKGKISLDKLNSRMTSSKLNNLLDY